MGFQGFEPTKFSVSLVHDGSSDNTYINMTVIDGWVDKLVVDKKIFYILNMFYNLALTAC